VIVNRSIVPFFAHASGSPEKTRATLPFLSLSRDNRVNEVYWVR
jgi:hypothetical protein